MEAIFRGCRASGERNGDKNLIDVPARTIVLIQDSIGTSIRMRGLL
jgi:hypothetical protein